MEEHQRPRQHVGLQQREQAHEDAEDQAVLDGEAEQARFLAFQADGGAGHGDGLG